MVGSNLARALLASGQPLRGIVHQDRRAVEGLAMELVSADLQDLPALCRAFQGVDVVYHLAGMISLALEDEPRMQQVNVSGVRNVLEACRAAGVRRLVHFSSIHALEQEPLDQHLDEERPLALALHHAPYDRTKAEGEKLVRQAIAAGLDAVILNPTAIVGPYDFKPSYFGQALKLIASGRLPALVTGGFDWVDVRDVVTAAIQAANTAPPGRRYLIAGHWRSVSQVARGITSLCGVRPPLVTVPLALAYQLAPLVKMAAMLNGSRPLYTRVTLGALRSNRWISYARAAQELNYQPRPFEETLQDTLAWFNSQSRSSSNESLPARSDTV